MSKQETKPCSICRIPKSLDSYAPNARVRSGLQAACRECVNARRREARKNGESARGPNGEFRHGRMPTYRNGCRCESCTEAARRANLRVVARRGEVRDLARSEAGAKAQAHGGSYAYEIQGCRCDDCVRWFRSHKRSRRRKREDRAGPPVNRGKEWTGPEMELLATRTDLTAVQLAQRLGRSVTATEARRRLVRHDPKWMKAAGVDDA